MKTTFTALHSGIALALGAASFAAQASLTTGAVLMFDPGVLSATPGLVESGSFFEMGGLAQTPISADEGLRIGVAQPVVGESHLGLPTGTENTSVDQAWSFFLNTGLHHTVTPTTATKIADGQFSVDLTGWRVNWSTVFNIDMGGDPANFPTTGNPGDFDSGLALVTCNTADCSVSSTFVLDYGAHVPLGKPFQAVAYSLHLEGHVASVVPIPATLWLFGSGLTGLMTLTRRRKKIRH